MTSDAIKKLGKSRAKFNLIIISTIVAVFLLVIIITLSKYLFFKKTVIGTVTSCQSLDATYADGNKVFSFSVEIKEKGTDEIINFSAEDRKWKSVQEGDEVKAVYFVYPWWDLSKAGTFYEGRLIKKFKKGY